MGGHDEKQSRPRILVRHVAVGALAFFTVAALVSRERHYRQRLEHDQQVAQGVCEAQARAPGPSLAPPQRHRSGSPAATTEPPIGPSGL